MLPAVRSLPIALCLLCLGACASVRDDLNRAQHNYEEAHYERALAWLDSLDAEYPGMSDDSRARYLYLRGMTAYRLGVRADALHYLALAREVAGDQGRALGPQWRGNMQRTLAELAPDDGPPPQP